MLGIEKLLSDKSLRGPLVGKRVAVVAHPASVNENIEHTVDLLWECDDINLTSAFGPQHGMRGEKQDNMIESNDYKDPHYGFPVYSLYGAVRKPTDEMLDSFDVVLLDLQDVGCRIYTFLTTMFYMMDTCAEKNKSVWILDRPNPAGRPIEGIKLNMGFKSFVGAAPIPMRHGLTLGEAANWYKKIKNLDLDLNVIKMDDYHLNDSPGFGWPQNERAWVNPSPNMPRIGTTKIYAGTVMIEGTKLSEGRGTTTPLEIIGAPDLNGAEIINEMYIMARQWMDGCLVRPCFFEPTFQKHQGKLCSGIQIHIDHPRYKHEKFKPYRLTSCFLKATRKLYGDIDLWLDPPYEYEKLKMPIDILSGSSELREWVDDKSATVSDWENRLLKDEMAWEEERREFLLY